MRRELEDAKKDLEAQLDALEHTSKKDPGKKKQIAGLRQSIAKLKEQIGNMKKEHSNRVADLQKNVEDWKARHESIEMEHKEIHAKAGTLESQLHVHQQEVVEECMHLCDEFYKYLDHFLEECTSATLRKKWKNTATFAQMHGVLVQLESAMMMHSSMNSAKACAMVERICTHVLCMWDFAQDVLEALESLKKMQKDAVYRMVGQDVLDMKQFLKKDGTEFSANSKFVEGMHDLEEMLLQFAKECSAGKGPFPKSMTRVITCREDPIQSGLLKNVKTFVDRVVALRILQRKDLSAQVKVSLLNESSRNSILVDVSVDSKQGSVPNPPPKPRLGFFDANKQASRAVPSFKAKNGYANNKDVKQNEKMDACLRCGLPLFS